MKRIKLQKIIPYALAASLILSGCGKKSDCNVPTWHVHKYTKSITKDITIEGYFHDEQLIRNDFHLEKDTIDYHWNKDSIIINENDRTFFKLITKNNLIRADQNWDYLYYLMSQQHDFLKFYWHYTTVDTYTDSNGNTHTRTVHHQGWSENPKHAHNTGKTVVCHHKYYAYRVVNKNGKMKVEKSPLVDDIREVLEEYPYVDANCYEIINSNYMNFNKFELSNLKVEEISPFRGPDLTKKEIDSKPYTSESTENKIIESNTYEFTTNTLEDTITDNSFIPYDESKETESSFVAKKPYTKNKS